QPVVKPNFNNSFKSTLARIFLFWIILNGVDLGFLDIGSCYSSGLPWEPNTEYVQEAEFFQDKHITTLDIFDVAGLDKTPVPHLIGSRIFHLNRRFYSYRQKLPKQEMLASTPTGFFLVASKSNIPHLNLDEEEPSGFQSDVV